MRREPARDPEQNATAGPLMCLQKKGHTSADALFFTQNLVKSKKGHHVCRRPVFHKNLMKSKKKRKRSSSCDGALFGQTGRAPENMTGPGTLYSPAPSLNTTGYKTVIDTGTSFLVGLGQGVEPNPNLNREPVKTAFFR